MVTGNFEISSFDEHDCPVDVGEKTLKPGRSGEKPQHYLPRSAYTAPALSPVLVPYVMAGNVKKCQVEIILKAFMHMKPTREFITDLKSRAAKGRPTDIDVHDVGFLGQYTALLVAEGHYATLGTVDHLRMKKVAHDILLSVYIKRVTL